MPTRRPRLLPTVLAASALVVATAGGVLAATGSSQPPSLDACPADYKPSPTGPVLAGCLDTTRPAPSDTAPTNPRG